MLPDSTGPGAVQGLHLTCGAAGFGGAPVFCDLDLRLPPESLTVLLGRSGVGKSTLLRLISGLPPPPGAVLWTRQGGAAMDQVALMDQRDLLLPWASVLANVVIGDRLRGRTPDRERALWLLEAVGLHGQEALRPEALSGGMRQRTALARTLYEERPIVLMDEPFASLDALTRLRLQDLACGLLRTRTILLVTHDPQEALRIADGIVVLSGRPARVDAASHPAGAAPRDPGTAQHWRDHARLMERLAS